MNPRIDFVNILIDINQAALQNEYRLEDAIKELISKLPVQIVEIFALENEKLIRKYMAYRLIDNYDNIYFLDEKALLKLEEKKHNLIYTSIKSYYPPFKDAPAMSDIPEFRQSLWNNIEAGKIAFSFKSKIRINPNVYEFSGHSATSEAKSYQNLRATMVKNMEFALQNLSAEQNLSPDPRYLIAYEKLHDDILPISPENNQPKLYNMIVIPLISRNDKSEIGVLRFLNCFNKTSATINFNRVENWFKDEGIRTFKLYSTSGISDLLERELSIDIYPKIDWANLSERSPSRRGSIVGSSEFLSSIYQKIFEAAKDDDATVLLLGESGVGKELVARSIHLASLKRKKYPFIPINIAVIPETLLEAELFGWEKDAHNKAHKLKKGKFELANKGTLFLDEIGDMPLGLQVKILRFLDDKIITRLGSESKDGIKLDVKIIAATKQSLEELVKEKKFRDDLYFRFNELPINIPSLKERFADIPDLITYFLESEIQRLGITDMQIDERIFDTSHYINNLDLSGNVRALRAKVKSLVRKYGYDRKIYLENWLDVIRYTDKESEPQANGLIANGPKKLKFVIPPITTKNLIFSSIDNLIITELGYMNYADIRLREMLLAEANGSIRRAAEANRDNYNNFYNNCNRKAENIVRKFLDAKKLSIEDIESSFPYLYSRFIKIHIEN